MKVFLNASGQWLVFHRAESKRIATGHEWVYEWSDSIHDATVSAYIPNGTGDKWRLGDTPIAQVVATLKASVKSTRVVTLADSS